MYSICNYSIGKYSTWNYKTCGSTVDEVLISMYAVGVLVIFFVICSNSICFICELPLCVRMKAVHYIAKHACTHTLLAPFQVLNLHKTPLNIYTHTFLICIHIYTTYIPSSVWITVPHSLHISLIQGSLSSRRNSG